MRNTWVLLAILLALATIYFIFIHGEDTASLYKREIDFAVADTAAIERIVLTRVAEGTEVQQLILERQSQGGWRLNKEYTASQPSVHSLLKTIHLLRVRETLTEAGKEAGKKLLDHKHTRIDIYHKRKLIKSYKVGTEGKGGKGTLMMLDKAQNPYVLEIPGFQGYLNSRYSMELDTWRENLLFDGALVKIKAISINYNNLQPSVRLFRHTQGAKWQLKGGETWLDSLTLSNYLDNFVGKVFAETFASNRYPEKLDELKLKLADVMLTINYFSGEERKINMYKRPENPNNYFGWIEGTNELLTIQRFVIDKYLITKALITTSG